MTRRQVAVPALCFALLFSTDKILRLGTVVYAAPIRQTVVDASAGLSGEYTDTADPDTPISFYVEDGKLVVESERMVPTALIQNSPTEFGVPQTKMALKFTLDSAGRGATVVSTNDPDVIYKRTGDPVHHVFHDYQRSEVMIPMRDGVKLHTVILKPTDIATPLPFLVQRTPYGVDGTSRGSFSADGLNLPARDTSTWRRTSAGASKARGNL